MIFDEKMERKYRTYAPGCQSTARKRPVPFPASEGLQLLPQGPTGPVRQQLGHNRQIPGH